MGRAHKSWLKNLKISTIYITKYIFWFANNKIFIKNKKTLFSITKVTPLFNACFTIKKNVFQNQSTFTVLNLFTPQKFYKFLCCAYL